MSHLEFVWPFPRLRFRLRTGRWCDHPYWERGQNGRKDGWHMIETGMRQMRRCAVCEWVQFR